MSLGEAERSMVAKVAMRPALPAAELVAIVADALLKMDSALRRLEQRVNEAERLAGRALTEP